MWNRLAETGRTRGPIVLEWMVTPDERTCQICFPAHGEQVPAGSSFSTGVPLPPAHPMCRCDVRQVMDPLLEKGVVPVVTGFIANTQDGTHTTLGRGGSDFTASIIGAAMRADEVWVWKDVDGLMTANPKIATDARMIDRISFSEAMELAHFGAQIIHPRALAA